MLRCVRGDTPLHIATRSLAVEVIEEFSLLPEWQTLRSVENAENLLPIDLVSETSENPTEEQQESNLGNPSLTQ